MDSVCQYETTLEATLQSRALGRGSKPVKPLHVLTLTPFYPHAEDDAAGCFVAEPLRFLHGIGVKNSIIATRPFYRSRPREAGTHSARWVRYVTPPGMAGLAFSGKALYLRIRSSVERLHAVEPLSLIHAHAALPCGEAASLLARRLEIPFVVTVHGRDVFSSRNAGVGSGWCERASKAVYRSAARVICISGRVQEDLLCGVDCRSCVVHNGVDTELFSPAVRRESHPVVLSVGNLIRTKGHENLLKATAIASRRHALVRLHIIGAGPEQQRLMHLARQLGIADRVEFLGPQSRAAVAKAMQGCSVFALASSYEGLGCVYLEAMATGTPAIGCTGQGIAEIISSGKNGWLIKPHDTEALADSLDQLLSDSALRNRIGLAGRQTVIEKFTMPHQARRLAEIYRESAP